LRDLDNRKNSPEIREKKKIHEKKKEKKEKKKNNLRKHLSENACKNV